MTKETMQPNQTLRRLINASHTHTRSVWIQINIINRHMPGGGAVFVQRSTFFFFLPPQQRIVWHFIISRAKIHWISTLQIWASLPDNNESCLIVHNYSQPEPALKKATLLHLFPYFVLSWLKQSEFSHYRCVQHCFSSESWRVFTDRGTKVHAVTNCLYFYN